MVWGDERWGQRTIPVRWRAERRGSPPRGTECGRSPPGTRRADLETALPREDLGNCSCLRKRAVVFWFSWELPPQYTSLGPRRSGWSEQIREFSGRLGAVHPHPHIWQPAAPGARLAPGHMPLLPDGALEEAPSAHQGPRGNLAHTGSCNSEGTGRAWEGRGSPGARNPQKPESCWPQML